MNHNKHKSKILAYFTCTVQDAVDYMDFNGVLQETILHITFKSPSYVGDVKIKLSELDKLNFEQINPSLLVNIEIPNADRMIKFNIRKQMVNLGERKKIICLSKLGWHKNDFGGVCYNAGNCIISEKKQNFICNPVLANKYRLDIYSGISERIVIKDIIKIMNIDRRYSIILFIGGLTGVLLLYYKYRKSYLKQET